MATNIATSKRFGRPRILSIEQVVKAGCEIGLERLDMTVLAKKLGIGIATLYGYVEDRDHLVKLVAARLATTQAVEDYGQNWDVALRDHLEGVFQAFRECPQLLIHQAEGSVGDPSASQTPNALLALLIARGLTPVEAMTIHCRGMQLVGGAALAASCYDRLSAEAGGEVAFLEGLKMRCVSNGFDALNACLSEVDLNEVASDYRTPLDQLIAEQQERMKDRVAGKSQAEERRVMNDAQVAERERTEKPPEKLPEMEGDMLAYMSGGKEPVTSSVLISNSRYLNNPYYRDVFAQIGLRRYGHDLPTTYMIPKIAKALSEVTDVPHYMELLEAEKTKRPEFKDWLAARRHTSYRREDVEGMAEGTLGHAIWKLLGIPGIKMDLGPGSGKIENDLSYINARRGHNHDIEHIVTGFGANAAGELALGLANIACCASYFTPEFSHELNAGIVLINSVVLQRTSLHYPAAMPVMLDAYRLGIEMGQALKRPLLFEPWEDMLDLQLEEIATRLGIVRGLDEGWQWTTEATTG